MPKTLAPYILQDGNRASSDLADVAVNAAGTLAAFVNSGVTAAGTYAAPTPAATVTVPPQRFALTNRTTGDVTLTFPNPAGTTITLTVMSGEVITFRQVSTSGYINESGNKGRAQLDARYVVQDLTFTASPAAPRVTTRINATVTSAFSNLGSVFINSELVSWWNEWGALRGSAHANSKFDALVRAIGRSDYAGAVRQGVGYAVFELLNNARTVQQWGRDWVDGTLYRNSIKHNDLLLWKTGDPDPTTDTTGKFGFGVYTQTISPSTFVILVHTSAAEATPTWAPAGRFLRFNLGA